MRTASGMGERLRYSKAAQWVPIPEWAGFLVELGFRLAGEEDPGKRTTCILAVPTRSYAATFAAAGAIESMLVGGVDLPNAREHFEALTKLREGDPLRFNLGGKSFRACFKGVVTLNDGRHAIRVQTQKRHGRAYLVTEDNSHQVYSETATDWELPKQQPGRNIQWKPRFLEAVLGNRYQELVSRSNIEVVIIGRLATLSQELTDTLFVTGGSSVTEAATLQEILRVKRLLPVSQPYRSEIYSSMREEDGYQSVAEPPKLAIFDGAQGFLKSRHHWRATNWLVLLDRTEPQFEVAVIEANSEYVRRLSSPEKITVPKVPKGLELMLYQESKQ